MTQQPVTEDRLNEFLFNLTEMYRLYYLSMGYQFASPTFTAEIGRKFIRIVNVSGNGGGRSVYCFIERNTGDILKSAGWKAPAKGARGSIWNESCDVGEKDKPCNVFGGGLYAR